MNIFWIKEHLETCGRSASYISKTMQNELLECISKYVQNVIVFKSSSQEIGTKYSIQADEVDLTDISNNEHLGLVL